MRPARSRCQRHAVRRASTASSSVVLDPPPDDSRPQFPDTGRLEIGVEVVVQATVHTEHLQIESKFQEHSRTFLEGNDTVQEHESTTAKTR